MKLEPTREHKRYTTGDPYLDLLGAVLRLAIADARRGNLTAAAWVRVVAPSLASRIGNGSEIKRKNPVVTAQKAADSTKRRKAHKTPPQDDFRGIVALPVGLQTSIITKG